MDRMLLIVAVFGAAAVAAESPRSAAEYFVATNGCDEANGSAAKPWRTIKCAADVAVAGSRTTARSQITVEIGKSMWYNMWQMKYIRRLSYDIDDYGKG